MQPLNQPATQMFLKLIEGLESPGDSKRFANNESFMPLVVEFNWQFKIGRQYSLSHYGEQNGDLMADPDMTFLVDFENRVFPITYRNDYAGVDQVAIDLKNESVSVVNEELQREMVEFTIDWLKNVWEQQGLQ